MYGSHLTEWEVALAISLLPAQTRRSLRGMIRAGERGDAALASAAYTSESFALAVRRVEAAGDAARCAARVLRGGRVGF